MNKVVPLSSSLLIQFHIDRLIAQALMTGLSPGLEIEWGFTTTFKYYFARDIDAINCMSGAINCMSDLYTQILQLSHSSKWPDRLLGAFIKSQMNEHWSTETQINANITLIWIQFFCVSQISVCKLKAQVLLK